MAIHRGVGNQIVVIACARVANAKEHATNARSPAPAATSFAHIIASSFVMRGHVPLLFSSSQEQNMIIGSPHQRLEAAKKFQMLTPLYT
jgi:hypothetical protein